MNKYTRRAEIYWNCHHVEKREIDPPQCYEAGSLPIEYSPWSKWDGWRDTGKISVPKLIFNPPDNYIFGDKNKLSMDCCDEIQGKIDSLQKELTECKLQKKREADPYYDIREIFYRYEYGKPYEISGGCGNAVMLDYPIKDDFMVGSDITSKLKKLGYTITAFAHQSDKYRVWIAKS